MLCQPKISILSILGYHAVLISSPAMDFVISVSPITALQISNPIGFVIVMDFLVSTYPETESRNCPARLAISVILLDNGSSPFLGQPCFHQSKATIFRTLALMLITVGLFLTGIGLLIALF